MAEEIAAEYKPPISPPKSNNKFPVKMVSQFLLKIQEKGDIYIFSTEHNFLLGGKGHVKCVYNQVLHRTSSLEVRDTETCSIHNWLNEMFLWS